MFRPAEKDLLVQQADIAERNYIIQKNDLLQLEVYTNKGEKITDPNQELLKQQSQANISPASYLVNIDGIVKFPQINELKLDGLTIRQAETILEKEYGKFYKETFVILKFANKRVVVLGAPGGQVIPLINENTRLTEVLALAKGLGPDAKAHNIRVLRGDKIMIADLSTFQSYKSDDIILEPGDIVYVEPVRRPFLEGVRDYASIFSVVTSLATLVFIIIETNNNN